MDLNPNCCCWWWWWSWWWWWRRRRRRRRRQYWRWWTLFVFVVLLCLPHTHTRTEARTHTYTHAHTRWVLYINKVMPIPLQARRSPGGWGSQDFKKIGKWKWPYFTNKYGSYSHKSRRLYSSTKNSTCDHLTTAVAVMAQSASKLRSAIYVWHSGCSKSIRWQRECKETVKEHS